MTASNASVSLRSSPNDTTAPGRVALDEPFDRLALAAGVARPQVDDATGRDRARGRGRRGRSRASTAAMAARTAARAAGMSSAWRTWNATDGPLRSTNSHGGAPSAVDDPGGQRLGVTARSRSNPGSGVTTIGAAAAAREPAVLEPVVAEVVDAADPRPLGDIGDGPPGQDRDLDAAPAGRRRSRRAGAAPGGHRARSARPPGRASRATACRRSRRRPGAAGGRPPAGRARPRPAAGDETASAGARAAPSASA